MRNTLILIGQIHSNQADGLDPYHAIIEATVQRSRPVILTALAAVLAFIPLTHSVFWGSMAYVLIGGTAVGTVLTLAFLPALYAIWFRVSYVDDVGCNHGLGGGVRGSVEPSHEVAVMGIKQNRGGCPRSHSLSSISHSPAYFSKRMRNDLVGLKTACRALSGQLFRTFAICLHKPTGRVAAL